jgi:hypothetical protein
MWGDSAARYLAAADNTGVWAWVDSASRYNGSAVNSLAVQSIDYCYSVRCECTDNTASDGFNYHADAVGVSTITKFLEVDCVSRRIGGATDSTDNGSTAHDKCVGIRLNCDYQESHGPCVADTTGAQSLNLGVLAGNSEAVTPSTQKSCYQVGTAHSDGTVSKIWMKNCTAVGEDNYARNVNTGGVMYDYGGFIDNTTGTPSGDLGTIFSDYYETPVVLPSSFGWTPEFTTYETSLGYITNYNYLDDKPAEGTAFYVSPPRL